MGRKSELIFQDRLTVDELSILNHELGNVLHGLSGMAGLLRDSGLTAEQGRWLEAIEQSGRQMCRIMESTLVYRDGAESGIMVKPGRMSGAELLESVMISHAPAALAKGLEIVLIADRELPSHWYSDCGLLRQLLDNLVGNAVKFTAAGHVILRAAVSQDDELELSVCDTGPGIGQPDRMFEPWQRGDSAATDPPGCGLGLYVCRRIVEGLGGSLSVNREPAGGSRFVARIPSVFGVCQGDVPEIQSLASLVCRLELEQPMMASVQGFLERLGVGWRCQREPLACGATCDDEILIESASAGSATASPGISLSAPGPGTRNVFLASPVLESGLERALFQLQLQRRFEGLSLSETPG